MHLAQRLLAAQQIQPRQNRFRHLARQRFWNPFQLFQHIPNRSPNPSRCQLAAAQRLVHRRDSADLENPIQRIIVPIGQHLKLRLDHLETAS